MKISARLLLAAFIVVGGLAGSSSPAHAHSGDESYLYLDITDSVSGRLEMPFADLREHLGFDLEGDEAELDSEIEANRELLTTYALQHATVGSGGATWSLTVDRVERLDELDYVGVWFDYAIEADQVPDVIDVRLDPFFEENPERTAFILIANDWKRGYFDNEADWLQRFDSGSVEQQVDLGSRSSWKNFTASVGLGVDHIKTGADHILFVLVLVLPAVLVFTNRWEPVPAFSSSLWRVLKIVTMFTVAHSITFTLAGLDLVPLPSSTVVESVIAVSIAVAAFHNLRPVLPDREWLIAFVFGLFHGFGFASLISELDLSRWTRLVSLAGRNIGIEIGQAIVVVVVFPLLFLLRRTRLYLPIFRAISVALIVISLALVAERVFDAPDLASEILTRLTAVPRSIVGIALLTLAAAAWYRREDAAGRLLPVAGDDSDTDEASDRLDEPVAQR